MTPEPIILLDVVDADDCDWDISNCSALQFEYVSVKIYKQKSESGNEKTMEYGNFTVWLIDVKLRTKFLSRSSQVLKRYSDFVRFREKLLLKLPSDLRALVPRLPSRVNWYDSWRYQRVNCNKRWLNTRREGLQYFLNQVFLNPVIVKHSYFEIQSFLGI